jgi:hypothetical protein
MAENLEPDPAEVAARAGAPGIVIIIESLKK